MGAIKNTVTPDSTRNLSPRQRELAERYLSAVEARPFQMDEIGYLAARAEAAFQDFFDAVKRREEARNQALSMNDPQLF